MGYYEDTGREKGMADTLMLPQAILKRYLQKVGPERKGFLEVFPRQSKIK